MNDKSVSLKSDIDLNHQIKELENKLAEALADKKIWKDGSDVAAEMIAALRNISENRAKKLALAIEALKVVGWHCSDDGSQDPDEMYDVIEKALKQLSEQ